MMHKYHPLWMNIHVNHPKEITRNCGRHPTDWPTPGFRWATRRAAGRRQRRWMSSACSYTSWSRFACAVLPFPVRPGGGRRTFPHPGLQRHRDHRRAARPHQWLRRADLRGGCARRRRQNPADAQYLISMAPGKVVFATMRASSPRMKSRWTTTRWRSATWKPKFRDV